MLHMINKKRIVGMLLCILLLVSMTVCGIIPANASTSDNNVGPNKKIALTFDDGPSAYTSRLLDILNENNAKATFFVKGTSISTYSNVLMRALSQGCEIAGHTWSHRDLTTLTSDEIRQELQSTNDALYDTLGIYPDIFRPPFGNFDENVVNVSNELGLAIILWAVTSLDWAIQDANLIYEATMPHARDGIIMLYHDTVEATIDAMEQIIPELIANGYDLVTVSEILDEKEAGQYYANGIHNWNGIIYTVQPSDSLWLISQAYGTTMNELTVLNELTLSCLFPGMRLRIPGTEPPPPVNYVEYVVQSGDSLWLISQAYGVTVEALMNWN
ncbi:MAG: polysaccharide deacetylase family protein, partial [Candidatus Bathyarchaeota archaeon]|nr:polysaccharide deacetylase family protein [Candidatus Termiticorpusculum sp.]